MNYLRSLKYFIKDFTLSQLKFFNVLYLKIKQSELTWETEKEKLFMMQRNHKHNQTYRLFVDTSLHLQVVGTFVVSNFYKKNIKIKWCLNVHYHCL